MALAIASISRCFLLLLALFFILPTSRSFETHIYLNEIKQSNHLQRFYFPYYNQTLDLIDFLLSDQERQTSSACDQSLRALQIGLQNFEEWALNLYEANGKPKNGKLSGYNGDLGNYDQCLSIRNDAQMGPQFSGQYCLVSIQTDATDRIKEQDLYKKNSQGMSESSRFITDFSLGTVQGVCLPSTCDIGQLIQIINKAVAGMRIVPQKHCSIADQSHEFSIFELVAFTCFGLLIFMCIISTVLPHPQLDHFHIGRNFMKLYNVNENAETTNHLHGTKVGYLFVGIIGHCWGMLLPFAPFLYGGFKTIQFGWVLRAIMDRILIGPDMMFFMSGFLSMYTWYNPMRKYKIGVTKYVLIRYFRCLAVVGIAILGGFIWPRLGSGPYFSELSQHFHKTCSERVWKNVLLINNQDRMLDICALPTWFLSSDFQLYLQSYFTTYYMAVTPKIGFILAALQIAINSAYTIYDAKVNNYPKYMTCTNITALNSMEVEQQYFFTYLHSNVYTLGIICGWLVASKKEIKLSTLKNGLIWISTLTMTLSAFYLPDLWHYNYVQVNEYLIDAWPVLGRLFFISAIFWSVYSTSFGYNYVLKRVLSCRFMITMSRMCMSIVTCQFFYLWYYLGTRRDLIRLTNFDLMREGVLAFFVCWFIGFLIHLFIEAPIVSLLYTMFGLRRRIELNDKEKVQDAIESKNVEEKKITTKDEPILDENANIQGECKSAYENENDNLKFERKLISNTGLCNQ